MAGRQEAQETHKKKRDFLQEVREERGESSGETRCMIAITQLAECRIFPTRFLKLHFKKALGNSRSQSILQMQEG